MAVMSFDECWTGSIIDVGTVSSTVLWENSGSCIIKSVITNYRREDSTRSIMMEWSGGEVICQTGFLQVSEEGELVRSGARGNPMGADSPHTTELTPEPHTKNNSSRDLKDSKLTKTFGFILVDDSNPERRKKNRSIAHSHVKKDQPANEVRAAHPHPRATKEICGSGCER